MIAIVTMVIDHMGLFFFPQIIWFRVVGRLSFILFAWLIANGARYTKNIDRYIKRLLIFALISQIPYSLAFYVLGAEQALNIFFTLALGLIAIKFIKQTDNYKVWAAAIIVTSLIAELINSDYGALGVLSISLFYVFYNNIGQTAVSQTILYLLFSLLNPQNNISIIQPAALISLAFIKEYNGKSGPRFKYLFYAFYPAHLVVLILLKIFV